MAKTARLDQILLQLGYVHVDEIAGALRRQRAHGGRLGMNLVQLGAITEEQLLTALAEQFRMPTLRPSESDIPSDLLERMPREVLAEGLAVPLAWNETQRVLSLAVSNPGDEAVMRKVKEAFGARGMRVGLAPEGLLSTLGRRLAPGESGSSPGTRGRVALPELFEREPPEAADTDAIEEVPVAERMVMLTSHVARKDFLPPSFQREGVDLVVASDEATLRKALEQPTTKLLVSMEMSAPLNQWRAAGLSTGSVDVVTFSSVSAALAENPVPYPATIRSLRSAVQALADYRSGEIGASPPYGLIAGDVAALAEEKGLRSVVTDGLDLCVHLLLPSTEMDTDVLGSLEPFGAFASSLELATRIRFPWALDAVLAACHGLYRGELTPEDRAHLDHETHLAAQVLALAWFRHNHTSPGSGSDEERMLHLRAELRTATRRLATTELVESYLSVIADRGTLEDDATDRQVLMVGGDRLPRVLGPALVRVGREAVPSEDLADAQTMMQRRAPAAVVIDHQAFGEGVDRFTRIAKLGGESLLFVLTDSTDPSLVLNLLDVGVDDVFGPPHDFDLIAARINRAIRSRAQSPRHQADEQGQFSATFDVFSFLDLVQMLSQGLKTVRIDLRRNSESAVIFMRKGRIVHAALGDVEGEPAVYAVLTWEDEGSFTVKEETRFPDPTVSVSTESVLMEGLRLLDESRRGN